MKLLSTALDAGVTATLKQGIFAVAVLCGSAMTSMPALASESPFIQAVSLTSPPSGARNLCQRYSWACASSGSRALPYEQELRIVRAVNRQVNASTQSVTDQSQYRTKDKWALPTRRGGDCEDFALLKKRDLVNLGLDPSKLLLATVLDTQRNSHAVLVYRSKQGDLVLDNLTNQIKPWKKTRYLFLRMQNPAQPGSWIGVFTKS